MNDEHPSFSSMRWIVAQEGSRQTYAVPVAFHRLELLRLFCVDIWCRQGRSILQHGTEGTRALATRYNGELPASKVISFSPAAIVTKSVEHFRRGGISSSELAYRFCRFGEWFARRVVNHLRTIELESNNDLFFGFNTNCLEALEWLKKRKICSVVDQVDPGKVEEDMVLEETERWPGWSRMPGRLPQSYWDRLKAEWNLADLVLVNSEWSANALIQQGVPSEKIIIVPLAIDVSAVQPSEPIIAKGTLKVLWLGSLILRKGIQYLVEAAKKLQSHDIEFLLAGPLGISDRVVREFPSNIKMLGRITRDHLSRVYREAQIFVLPTISDGFGVTQLEAMERGLPVIATPNCGRVVTDGVDGFIIPARDSDGLAAAIARLDSNRKLLREMSFNALKTVRKYDLPSNARMIHEITLRRRAAIQTERVASYA